MRMLRQMKYRIREDYLLIFFSMLLLIGCESGDNLPEEASEEILVRSITVGEKPHTRGEGAIKDDMIGTPRFPILPVSFLRLDSTDPAYPADYSGVTDVKSATISTNNANPLDVHNVLAFTPSEYYLSAGKDTKLWGWHPTTATWDNYECRLDFGELDGSTDVMSTGFITGNNHAPFSHIIFHHLLTQVIIKAYADDDTENEWGGLQSITLEDKKQTFRLKLGAADAAGNPELIREFGTPTGDMDLVKKLPSDHSDILVGAEVYGIANPLVLPTDKASAVVCGYAMIAPNTSASDELVLHIETEYAGSRTIAIRRQLLAGNAYTFTLSFKKTSIGVAVAVGKWNVVSKEIVI